MRLPSNKQRSGGFTIIELLIATVVFAMVLMVVTYGVLSFTRTYIKGVNQSKTQNAARTITEGIAQAIQFSGGDVTVYTPGTNGLRGFCINNQRYSYVTGVQLTDMSPDVNQSRRVLVLDEPGNCGGLPAQNVHGNPDSVLGKELLSPRMRVSKLRVQQVGATPMYEIVVRVVYGDDDLLCSPSANSGAGDCNSNTASGNLDNDDLSCKIAFSGSQYCATAELSTKVNKRITQ